MLFFNRFRRAFGQTAIKKPLLGTLLGAAFARQVCIEVLFTSRNRQMDDVYCRIKEMRPSSILLVSNASFLPDVLNDEQCLVYFNLPRALLIHRFKMSAAEARQGFLCKTRIIHNHVDPESRQCKIEIGMPDAYVQRELRRHERIFPSVGMVRSVDLWLRGRLPSHWRELGEPDFSFREGSPGQLRLVNISAGGARLEMDDVDEAERYHRLSNTDAALHSAQQAGAQTLHGSCGLPVRGGALQRHPAAACPAVALCAGLADRQRRARLLGQGRQ